mgnify:CR=1 FL=1
MSAARWPLSCGAALLLWAAPALVPATICQLLVRPV